MAKADVAKATAKLEGKLMKLLRRCALDYHMIEPDDHIMVCVSGGKDSATLLHLLMLLQTKLQRLVAFKVTAVHLDQQQPGYDGAPLVKWLQAIGVDYRVVSEDTYSIVKEKTAPGKGYCSMCSRLRRGILYSCAEEIGATKLALGHHLDDAAETLFLNMIHQGQLKAMPARYYSEVRDTHVLRPLMYCQEGDIAAFAEAMAFPILPCTLCGTQPDAHRAKVKLLCGTLESLNPNAKKNVLNALSDVRPSHLLDKGLRAAAGLDPVTGAVAHPRARGMRGYVSDPVHVSPETQGGWSAPGDEEEEDDPLLLL